VHFEPAGLTGNPQIPVASSLVDYIFRWLAQRYLGAQPEPRPARKKKTSPAAAKRKPAKKDKRAAGAARAARPARRAGSVTRASSARPRLPAANVEATSTGLGCPDCGSILVFAEGCLICRNCGYTKCG